MSVAPFRVALCALALAACARGEPARLTADSTLSSGPDAIVLRVAQSGGLIRAYRYPRLDSLIWRSTESAPALSAILGFDHEAGVLAYLSKTGVPGWIDLRIGTVRPATRLQLSSVSTADAWAVYGIRRDTIVQRLTPSGDWSVALKGKLEQLFPLPDGSLLVLRSRDGGTQLVRLRPPESGLLDSVDVEMPQRSAVSPLGDRLYFAANREVLPLGAQTLRAFGRFRLRDDAAAMIATPSGDRIFVALERRPEIDVIDRFSAARRATIHLPGPARELRIDPLGRMLLARPATGDSIWVISIATNAVVQRIASEWRDDLPSVAADGAIAAVQSGDVLFAVPGETRPRLRVKGGASELWYFVFWNGFRPRSKQLDLPVVFEDSLPPMAAPDSVLVVTPDSTATLRPPRVDSTPSRPPPVSAPVDTPSRPVTSRTVWTVSFAAVLSDERAREVAQRINVDGQTARVVVTLTEGVRIHRVVLGPYPTRADAERVGKASGRSYWVFEGPP